MVPRNLRQLLDAIGQDSFYLMHLSWAGRERARLWQFAKRKSLIGIDSNNPDISQKWPKVPRWKKDQLGQTWRHQFDLFARMQEGQCFVVAEGQYAILGVGLVEGPYDFKPQLHDFFRHVRKARWLLTDGTERIKFLFAGFQNTLQVVDKTSEFWPITRKSLKFSKGVPPKLRSQAAQRRMAIQKKYGPAGEGVAHKELKEWVANNPEALGLPGVAVGQTEYAFQHSGDKVDVMFSLPEKRYAVAEIETDNPMPGAFQALKYRVLRCAELGLKIDSSKVLSFLVAWKYPEDMAFCRKYKVRFLRKRL